MTPWTVLTSRQNTSASMGKPTLLSPAPPHRYPHSLLNSTLLCQPLQDVKEWKHRTLCPSLVMPLFLVTCLASQTSYSITGLHPLHLVLAVVGQPLPLVMAIMGHPLPLVMVVVGHPLSLVTRVVGPAGLLRGEVVGGCTLRELILQPRPTAACS